MLALAADHVILDVKEFRATCLAGRAAAEAGSIVTFGIKPSEPKTSYGYILPGEPIGGGVHKVKRFVEKPDAATAERYVREGYLWNSGNFLFRADVLLGELARLEPDMAEAIEAAVNECQDRSRFLAARARGLRARAAEIDRLCGDGKDRARGRCRVRFRLVGHWKLGRPIRHSGAEPTRQCRARRRRNHGERRLRRTLRWAIDCPARRERSRGGEHLRRGDGGAARARAGGARTHRQAQGRQPAGGDRAQARAPALGLLRVRSTWASASRSSASSSIRAACCRCRSTATAPSTGWS